MGGAAATPTVYKVTMKKVEFKRTDGTYYEFWSGSSVMDIASVSDGEDAGSVGDGDEMAPGSYTHLRVEFDNSFTIKGEESTTNCQTGTGFTTNAFDTGTVLMTESATGTGSAAEQTIDIPLDDGDTLVYSGMTGESMELLDTSGNILTSWTSSDNPGSVRTEMALPKTLEVTADSQESPSMGMDFQVDSKLEFAACSVTNNYCGSGAAGNDGKCLGSMMPPVITLTVSGSSTSYESTM